ncbi:sigma-54-dependent transcriptional regulator [Ralstonia syzygii]|uniref:Transcriptional response regulator,C4-dicarboxylate transport response regulator n=1 Tax=Ralstonia syzygii R24 TaxID=907261 RepID=G3A421_9RALS|nr:sigma-54 dependent transcriptional regulator [Ralstonia syzygii]CCA88647.1 transcriptional response regulator,C4-dicarboxylate transport response regulator [Ralstonia syzygii R24]
MSEGLNVLFIEDDPPVRQATAQSLELAGFQVQAYGSAEEAVGRIDADFCGVVVSDLRLPGASGLDVLAHCQSFGTGIPVVLVTGHGDITMAVQAMRDGAFDFIEKPFPAERLTETVRRAVERRALELENRALRRELAGPAAGTRIIGRSQAMASVRALIDNVAATDAPVLINGETGTGKELVARSLHMLSPRHDKPFIALNCGAVPEQIFESEMFGHEAGAFTGAGKRRIGKLEHASGGTLFLDETESMPLALQVKLLRVLQEGMLERLGSNASVRIDVRIVAAAKGDMEALIEAGGFRRDLYYRLNVVVIDLPPLRERREDIIPLFEHFLLEAAVRYQRPLPMLSERQRHELMQSNWPGNVRELRNAADRLVLGVGRTPVVSDAAEDGMPLKERVERYERTVIAETLARTGGSVHQAADILQLGRATLYDKIKRYGL